MAFLFYCQFYDYHDWRISQSLPDEGQRAPARIRASSKESCSPLDPALFWETVDETDRWNSRTKGVRMDWYFEDEALECVCRSLLQEIGLSEEMSTGWLAHKGCPAVKSSTSIIKSFRRYFSKNQFHFCISSTKVSTQRPYPNFIRLDLKDISVPQTVKTLMGPYKKTNKLLYKTPVYKQIDGDGWLFYCEKYENHDWRVSPELPEEGERAPARIRSYTKNACSPIEPGLFWEAVNFTNRWNTVKNAVGVVPLDENPHSESTCFSILSSLGLPREDCVGWLASWCEPLSANGAFSFNIWYTVFENFRMKINLQSLPTRVTNYELTLTTSNSCSLYIKKDQGEMSGQSYLEDSLDEQILPIPQNYHKEFFRRDARDMKSVSFIDNPAAVSNRMPHAVCAQILGLDQKRSATKKLQMERNSVCETQKLFSANIRQIIKRNKKKSIPLEKNSNTKAHTSKRTSAPIEIFLRKASSL